MHIAPRFGLLLLAAAVMDAGPININFENGNLSGWTTVGNATVTNSSFGAGPIQGSFSGLVTNGAGSVPITTLESMLGLQPGTIASFSGVNVTEGSGITQTFTAQAGDQFTLLFLQLTSEPNAFSGHETFFVTFTPRGSTGVGGSPTYVSAPASTGFLYVQTGSFCLCRIPALTAGGSYTVTFAVADDGTPGVKSGLLVDGTYAAATPEPSAVWLAGGGLLVLAWAGRRRFHPTKQG